MKKSIVAVRSAFAALAILAVTGSVVLAAPPAMSDIWPYPSGAPEPDRGSHWYCFDIDSLPNLTVRSAMQASMSNLESQTQVVVELDSPCHDWTDVRWQQRPIGDRILGRAQCIRLHSNGRCHQYLAMISWGEIVELADSPVNEARHTACHELGHTVGLAHYGNGDPYIGPPDPPPAAHSCMRSGVWDSGSVLYRTYGTHHIGHVNDHF